MVRPGISTSELELEACRLMEEAAGRPAFKNYEMPNGLLFPSALCTSINDEVVHAPALPGRILEEGDLLKIDMGMEYPLRGQKLKNPHSELGGFYSDMAVTIAVGKIDKKKQKLVDVTKDALRIGIEKVKPGNTVNDIGAAIQEYVEKNGFSVVRDMVGHGVGHEVHEAPQIPHYRINRTSPINAVLKPGMVIAIEPMVNAGGYKIHELDDAMTYATDDGEPSAQFEHTVAVTEDGYKILTAP
jgi:methionyl aminopeptidase